MFSDSQSFHPHTHNHHLALSFALFASARAQVTESSDSRDYHRDDCDQCDQCDQCDREERPWPSGRVPAFGSGRGAGRLLPARGGRANSKKLQVPRTCRVHAASAYRTHAATVRAARASQILAGDMAGDDTDTSFKNDYNGCMVWYVFGKHYRSMAPAQQHSCHTPRSY